MAEKEELGLGFDTYKVGDAVAPDVHSLLLADSVFGIDKKIRPTVLIFSKSVKEAAEELGKKGFGELNKLYDSQAKELADLLADVLPGGTWSRFVGRIVQMHADYLMIREKDAE